MRNVLKIRIRWILDTPGTKKILSVVVKTCYDLNCVIIKTFAVILYV